MKIRDIVTEGEYASNFEQEDIHEGLGAAIKAMSLIMSLAAAYGLADEAKDFIQQLKSNIEAAQNAEPHLGNPDPVSPGNPEPGTDRIMRPKV